MNSEMALEEVKDEVLRKIGRNLLLFQQVEHMLKFLIANGQISGYASDISKSSERRAVVVHKQTMGQLVGQFLENTYSDVQEGAQEPEELEDIYFSFSFKIESDADYFDTKSQALASIITDRNELIHHFLPRFNPESLSSCLENDKFLEQQKDKLIPEIEQLKGLVEALDKGKKQLAEFLGSEAGKAELKYLFLKNSSLSVILQDIALQSVNSGGWVNLSSAGRLIRKRMPREIEGLKEMYGHSTLKGFLLATELFDTYEEPTKKGGFRFLYRLKPCA